MFNRQQVKNLKFENTFLWEIYRAAYNRAADLEAKLKELKSETWLGVHIPTDGFFFTQRTVDGTTNMYRDGRYLGSSVSGIKGRPMVLGCTGGFGYSSRCDECGNTVIEQTHPEPVNPFVPLGDVLKPKRTEEMRGWINQLLDDKPDWFIKPLNLGDDWYETFLSILKSKEEERKWNNIMSGYMPKWMYDYKKSIFWPESFGPRINHFNILRPQDLAVKPNNSTATKPNMNTKPFDLEEALAGKPVVTRSGQKVTEIVSFKTEGLTYPIRAIIGNGCLGFTKEGMFDTGGSVSDMDLFMKVETKTVWFNVYLRPDGTVYTQFRYDTEKEAKSMVACGDGEVYLGTFSREVEV